jgi:hypothetical protein
MPRPTTAELEAAAAALDQHRPAVASWLRKIAQPRHDLRELRRDVLRRCHRLHLSDMKRSPAARMLAIWWASLDTERPATPGTIPAELQRLHRAGIAPVAHRTIVDDLDPSFD